MSNKKWFVLYSKPRWEKKLDTALIRKGVESWCPVKKVEKQWSDRKKIIDEPLFRSYVFVRIAETEMTEILTTPGALQFVFYLRKPAIVKDREIEEIKNFLLLEQTNIETVDSSIFKTDTKVRIRKGVFMDSQGTVLRTGKKRVYVAIETLGTVMVVEFKADHLHKI